MGWLSSIGSLFGGGGSSGSSIWGDLFKGVLSGLGASAGAKADAKQAERALGLQGLEARKSLAYGAQLEDFYANKKNYKDARALDSYGQFSRVSQFAPGYRPLYQVQDPGNPPPPQA